MKTGETECVTGTNKQGKERGWGLLNQFPPFR